MRCFVVLAQLMFHFQIWILEYLLLSDTTRWEVSSGPEKPEATLIYSGCCSDQGRFPAVSPDPVSCVDPILDFLLSNRLRHRSSVKRAKSTSLARASARFTHLVFCRGNSPLIASSVHSESLKEDGRSAGPGGSGPRCRLEVTEGACV